jgi:hypothetical protein
MPPLIGFPYPWEADALTEQEKVAEAGCHPGAAGGRARKLRHAFQQVTDWHTQHPVF